MIEISQAAADFIHQSATKQNQNETDGLRIAVYPDNENSCFNYGLGFDAPKASDEVYNVDGIKLIIDIEQIELLGDAAIDFVKLDDGKMNLIVLNPNDPSHIPPKKINYEKTT